MDRKKVFIGLIAGLILTVVFNYSLVLNISKPLSPNYTDATQIPFVIKHNLDTIFAGKFSELTTLPMYYGVEDNIFYSYHFIIKTIISAPLYLLTGNIFLTFNILILINIFASFFSMYLLAFYFIKDEWLSVLAGIIFVFNPYVYLFVPDALELVTLMWIPMVFLFFEKWLKKQKNKDFFWLIFFLALQILSSLYYAAFMTVIFPIYAILRMVMEKVPFKKIINKGLFFGALFLIPIVIWTASGFSHAYGPKIPGRNLQETALFYSATVFSWFVAPTNNMLYGKLGDNLEAAAPSLFSLGHPKDMNYFPGLLVLFLFIKSIRNLRKINEKKIWLIFLGLLVLSFLLSLGPTIEFTNYFGIPGPYLIVYYLNPIFHKLRVAARFAVFVFFFLSLICPLMLGKMLKNYRSFIKKGIIFAVILIVIIEYMTKPLNFASIDQGTKSFYDYLKREQNIKVIIDWPIGNRLPDFKSQGRTETKDGYYLFWQMIHNKNIFNGYSSVLPEKYVERVNYLSLEFPTQDRINSLKSWGVQAIVLHQNQFKNTKDYARVKDVLLKLKIPLIRETKDLSLFDLTAFN